MTYVRALVVAIAGAAFGAIAGAFVGALLAPLFGFTSFEGGSGLFAVYTAAAAGALIGFVLAAAMALCGHGDALVRRVCRPACDFPGRCRRNRRKRGLLVSVREAHTAQSQWAAATARVRNPASRPALCCRRRRARSRSISTPTAGSLRRELSADGFRRDRDQQVIAGSVEMKHRSDHRMLVLNRPGEVERIFHIHVGTQPEHTEEFGPWETVRYARDQARPSWNFARNESDEIRYRTVWPGPSERLKLHADCGLAVLVDQGAAPGLAVEQGGVDRVGGAAVVEIGGDQHAAACRSRPCSAACSAGTGVWPSKNATS